MHEAIVSLLPLFSSDSLSELPPIYLVNQRRIPMKVFGVESRGELTYGDPQTSRDANFSVFVLRHF